MYVPNYIPEPLEVPGNASLESYRARLGYIRRVTFFFLATVPVVAASSWLDWPMTIPWLGMAVFGACILLLDVVRVVLRGSAVEAKVSAASLPVLLAVAGWAIACGSSAGLPMWTLGVGPLAATLYTLLAGRDYSFVGCFFISWIAGCTAVAAVAIGLSLSGPDAATALLMTSGFLGYWVYDLASMMSRRRVGEEWASVVDFYRDPLNFVGYGIRCLKHWRKHHIWALPPVRRP
jgi:hypothetical protein